MLCSTVPQCVCVSLSVRFTSRLCSLRCCCVCVVCLRAVCVSGCVCVSVWALMSNLCVCVCIFESKAKLRQNNKIFTALTKVLCKIWQINYEIALKCRVRGKERGRADMSVRVCTWNSFENELKINKVNCINILHLTFYIHTSVQLYVCMSVCVVHRERKTTNLPLDAAASASAAGASVVVTTTSTTKQLRIGR